MCAACATKDSELSCYDAALRQQVTYTNYSWTDPIPFEHCRRPVRFARPRGCESSSRPYQPRFSRRRRYFCCELCASRFANARRQRRSAEARQLKCVCCSKPLVAERADQQFCSSACRQRAYRQRRRAA
jgi:hypothetical protein